MAMYTRVSMDFIGGFGERLLKNRTRDQNHMHCPISNQIVKIDFWFYIVNFYKKHSFVSDIKNVCDYY